MANKHNLCKNKRTYFMGNCKIELLVNVKFNWFPSQTMIYGHEISVHSMGKFHLFHARITTIFQNFKLFFLSFFRKKKCFSLPRFSVSVRSSFSEIIFQSAGLIASLFVFFHLGFSSGNFFLIASFPDHCLLVPF